MDGGDCAIRFLPVSPYRIRTVSSWSFRRLGSLRAFWVFAHPLANWPSPACITLPALCPDARFFDLHQQVYPLVVVYQLFLFHTFICSVLLFDHT